MYHSLFNHSSTEEHLCYFWDLAVINKATIKFHVQDLCEHKFSFLCSKFPGIQLLYHMVVSCLCFKKPPDCFTEWLYQFTFSPAMYAWFSSSEFSRAFGFLSVSYFSHFDRCVVMVYCGFILHFPNSKMNIFSCFFCHQYILSSIVYVHTFHLFSNWVVCFFRCSSFWVTQSRLVLCWLCVW